MRLTCLVCVLALLVTAVLFPGAAAAEEKDAGIMNVLLCGVERDEGGDRPGVIIILSADTLQGGIRLTFVSGNILVSYDGREAKLSAFHYSEGPEGTAAILSALLGTRIGRYVSVDMEGFRAAVDACGGVEIDLSAEEAAAVSRNEEEPVLPGMRTLNGRQALSYVRLRGENAAGSARHWVFLTAMARKALSGPGIGPVLDMAEQLLPYMETNLTAADLFRIILAALTTRPDRILSCSLPGEGEYEPDGEGALCLTDTEGMAERFMRFILSGER